MWSHNSNLGLSNGTAIVLKITESFVCRDHVSSREKWTILKEGNVKLGNSWSFWLWSCERGYGWFLQCMKLFAQRRKQRALNPAEVGWVFGLVCFVFYLPKLCTLVLLLGVRVQGAILCSGLEFVRLVHFYWGFIDFLVNRKKHWIPLCLPVHLPYPAHGQLLAFPPLKTSSGACSSLSVLIKLSTSHRAVCNLHFLTGFPTLLSFPTEYLISHLQNLIPQNFAWSHQSRLKEFSVAPTCLPYCHSVLRASLSWVILFAPIPSYL